MTLSKMDFDEFEKLSNVATREEIDSRKQVARKMASGIEPFFESFQKRIFSDPVIEDIEEWEDLLMAAYVSSINGLIKIDDPDVLSRESEFVKNIIGTTLKAFRDSLSPDFVNAYTKRYGDLGTGAMSEDEALSGERIQRIAANESMFINNKHEHDEAAERGYTKHVWRTQEDEKVRLSHSIADFQVKDIDEPFSVGGELLMFPGDTSLGATPDETINCRCFETYRE